jgi:Rps23 Pro-64 3,4-dihydroxylase Tpa1-like proline 4-hydroxylase
MVLALHLDIDPVQLRERYAATGIVQIQPFLAEADANRLASHLQQRDDWTLSIKSGAKGTLDFGRAVREQFGPAKIESFIKFAHPEDESQFRFAYEKIVAVEGEAEQKERDSVLAEFATFMSSSPVLDMFRDVTGSSEIDFADVQATRYTAGHFLTKHHDKKSGSRRIAAYVLGLTDDWLPEWGGLLLFHDRAGDVAQGFTPKMNTLSLFSVPQDHSVSAIVPYCSRPRLSLTGWLRPFS